MNKAAIVIGVNQTGDLPLLNSAVTGAKRIGQWLTGEGFEIFEFVDTDKPVTTGGITKQVINLVNRGTLEQLVIFFSGHGFLNNNSEFWLLSGAPRNPNEAISLTECVTLARQCGIPSVVFISDACRSLPETLTAERVRGSLIFPNDSVTTSVDPEVDRFFATLPGSPAMELPLADSVRRHVGAFTHCWLQAYRQPTKDMVRQISLGAESINVIPNRKLKEYLRREVPNFLRQQDILVDQLPRAIVESGENTYLAQVRPESLSFGLPAPKPREITDVGDVATVELARAVGTTLEMAPSWAREDLVNTAEKSGFAASVARLSTAQEQGRGHYETRTGLTVVGAEVTEATGLNMGVDVLHPGDGTTPGYIRLTPMSSGDARSQVSSVLLRFAGGTGTVLAGLENYIGTVLVEQGRVMNVSYVPSDNSPLWSDYVTEYQRLEKLRALVAAAAAHGVFQIDSENAVVKAHMLRYLKRLDPTLGLYAAYAYADVGRTDQVQSILEYMERDLSAWLFDAALLAGKPVEARRDAPEQVVPFCPMLSQGWDLLRVKPARLPAPALAAQDHLLPALWTTFTHTGMDILAEVIQERSVL